MDVAQPVSIVVDHREAPSGVVELLRAHEEVTVTVASLPCGDFRLDDHLLVERKTLPDLVASIQDGRLFSQGSRLARAGPWSVLILEGTSRDLAMSGMRREAIQGALITVTLYLGVPLLRAQDLEETVQLMLYAARQGRRVASGALPRQGRRPRGKARLQARVLQGLPGVGPTRAKRLLERFGTVEAVMTADTQALAAVRGIGSGTAHAIRWAVRDTGVLHEREREGIFPL
jgi:ERCC4-type nuclease